LLENYCETDDFDEDDVTCNLIFDSGMDDCTVIGMCSIFGLDSFWISPTTLDTLGNYPARLRIDDGRCAV